MINPTVGKKTAKRQIKSFDSNEPFLYIPFAKNLAERSARLYNLGVFRGVC